MGGIFRTSATNTILIVQDPTTISFEKFLIHLKQIFFDDSAKHHCMAVHNEALKIVLEYITGGLPEVG